MATRRTYLKIALWVILTPVLLFTLLMTLLYVPSVQNFIRKEAMSIASESTGMDVSVGRISLHFPLNLLVRDVRVVQPADSMPQSRPDTLLRLSSLDVQVQAWPLLSGQVEIDNVTLSDVFVNSARLLEGMRIEGRLGRFFFESHGVDLLRQDVTLNNVELSDTHVQLLLADTTAAAPPDTTASAPLAWKFSLYALRLDNVSMDLRMPLDTMTLAARVGKASLTDAHVDLGQQLYSWGRFQLSESALRYDAGNAPVAQGFDASHIDLRGLRLGIDSVRWHGRNLNAVIREFSLYDRSGLTLSSLTGRLTADSSVIRVPSLQLRTPHSEMNLTAQTYWKLVDMPNTGRLTARFDAHIGKQDVLLFAGGLPETFTSAYPFRPLIIRAGTEGNLRQMQLSRFTAELPGAFALNGGGALWNLTDSLTRKIDLSFRMQTRDLNFLTGLTGLTPDGSIVVPDSMDLAAKVGLEGTQCMARLDLRERQGTLKLDAAYNLATEAYRAELRVDSLQLHHFLPKDSLYRVSADLMAQGQGFDFVSPQTEADVRLAVDELQYGHWTVTGVEALARLRKCFAALRLKSDNSLLAMQARGGLHLDRSYLDGNLKLDVDQVNFYELGLSPKPLERPFAFDLNAEARHDSIKLKLEAGDLNMTFLARSTLKRLMEKSSRFAELLTAQIEDRRLDHAALRRVLPSAGVLVKAGADNPVSRFLEVTQNVRYDSFMLNFGFTPERGINGRSAIMGLRADSLQLDTVFLAIRQDTTRMQLQGGVVNGPQNPQFVFRSTLTGEIRNADAELTVKYVDGEGKTGVLLGLNARPLTEGHGKGNGMLLTLIPEEPIVAYRKFRFAGAQNWAYVHKDMRVYAGISMEGDDGMRFRVLSDRSDTVSLQNLDIELSRFRLSELSSVMPYLPRLTGLFSAKAKYILRDKAQQLSAETEVRQLTYEGQQVGDVGIGASWMPEGTKAHHLNAYLSYNGEKVVTAIGQLNDSPADQEESLQVDAAFLQFPLRVANAFVPDQMITLSGKLNGTVRVSGSMDNPKLNGAVSMDSTWVFARQYGAHFSFDRRPLKVQNNRLLFDKFAIYTTSRNPFTIDGYVDFADMNRPSADLRLLAGNYTVLDVPRKRQSLIYGKVVVDLMASIRGPLDALTMRGNMNLLGNTDVTYVLTDSPLTVEDRLEGLVAFTSFADTLQADAADEMPTMSLGGLDMIMTVHIDNAVRLRADLSADRSKFVELEGGGDLSLQYTPQGDMSLSGRYTLSGGTLKYSLPVIPLKEFKLASGSYVDWRGDLMNPTLNLTAAERVRASVADGDDGATRMVDFDVSISIKNRLSAPELIFDIAAPEDATVENELQAMGAEERSKQAIAMLATGVYLNSGLKGGGLNMGTALNSVLQSQINALAGSALESVNASFSVGVEDRTAAETGDKQTDYSFRYSQRFFNDRVQIVIGGKVSTGANATNDAESFIDNISLEYRLDASGTRYIRAFYNKNYESVLDGEITETGVGLVLRRKMDRLGELFIFKRRKPVPVPADDDPETDDHNDPEPDDAAPSPAD